MRVFEFIAFNDDKELEGCFRSLPLFGWTQDWNEGRSLPLALSVRFPRLFLAYITSGQVICLRSKRVCVGLGSLQFITKLQTCYLGQKQPQSQLEPSTQLLTTPYKTNENSINFPKQIPSKFISEQQEKRENRSTLPASHALNKWLNVNNEQTSLDESDPILHIRSGII